MHSPPLSGPEHLHPALDGLRHAAATEPDAHGLPDVLELLADEGVLACLEGPLEGLVRDARAALEVGLEEDPDEVSAANVYNTATGKTCAEDDTLDIEDENSNNRASHLWPSVSVSRFCNAEITMWCSE